MISIIEVVAEAQQMTHQTFTLSLLLIACTNFSELAVTQIPKSNERYY